MKETYNLTNQWFDCRVGSCGIAGILSPSDFGRTEFVRQGEHLSAYRLLYEADGKRYSFDHEEADCTSFYTDMDDSQDLQFDCTDRQGIIGVSLHFRLAGKLMDTAYSVKNLSRHPISLLDLSTYCPMNTHFEWGVPAGDKVICHSFVGGHSSFLYAKRCDGTAPYLLIMPQENTSLELIDTIEGKIEHQEEHNGEFYGMRRETFLNVYLLSSKAGQKALAGGTKLRHRNSSVTLQPGQTARFSFRYAWACSDEEVRDLMAESGLLDILAVPGYTLPAGMDAKLSVRSAYPDVMPVAEFPDQTDIRLTGRENGRDMYELRFRRLGENKITFTYDGGTKWTDVLFFAAEPVSALLDKRAGFLTKTRCTDRSKWYYGLFCEWNNKTNIQLSPDNYDDITGWRIYEVASDDAGFGKPAFLSAKIAERPVQAEIDALDDYIEYYVWGGLQMTEEEEYPYAVYGTPDWHAHRTSDDPGPGLTSRGARLHFWRIYDYPHIFLMYFNMYRAARDYPGIKTRLSKEEYLKRAYKTAWAMFVYPYEVDAWSADDTALMNEIVVGDIIAELYKTGHFTWAQRLRFHWDRKIKNFVVNEIDIFGSEYPFDTTGFETTHAMAKNALNNAVAKEDHFGLRRRWPIPRDKAVRFMQKQITCNMSCRGTIEPAFFWYGSDYRAQNYRALLSYMSQMGGWSILDYALYHAEDPFACLRVGYGSMLSSWALINSGSKESDYGYWFPGEELDGAACGAYEVLPSGTTWLGQEHHGGCWYYSGESDGGFCAGIRGMATILADDPVFGLFCYGGSLKQDDGDDLVSVCDGVNRRLHYISGSGKLHFILSHGKISQQLPVKFSKNRDKAVIPLDCSQVVGTDIELEISAQQFGSWTVYIDENQIGAVSASDSSKTLFRAENAIHTVTLLRND